MRIAVVYLDIRPHGGVQKTFDQVLGRLGNSDDLKLFTLHFEPSDFYEYLNRIDKYVSPVRTSFRGRLTRYYAKKRYLDLANAIRNWSPDVILLARHFYYSKWLSESVRKPIVLYLHNSLDLTAFLGHGPRWQRIGRDPVTKLYGKLMEPADLTNADFSSVRLTLCGAKQVESDVLRINPRAKTSVVYGAVDHSYYRPSWEDRGYALCIGRFTMQKNTALLKEALGGAPYQVIICGEIPKGTMEKESRLYLESLLSEKPPNLRVNQNLKESELHSLLLGCSVFLHPAKEEGFPLTILEAMSCGKPVVAHDSGGSSECVGDGGFVLGDRPELWSEKVGELMASQSLRSELGRKAYERSKAFTWERTAAEFKNALGQAI